MDLKNAFNISLWSAVGFDSTAFWITCAVCLLSLVCVAIERRAAARQDVTPAPL